MKRGHICGGLVCLLALALAPAMASAQDGGEVARVTYWKIRDGHLADFEAGLAAHNQLHVEQKDPHPLLTWQIVSGKREGQYLRGSFGHEWSDFDVDPATAEADAADSAKNLDPHIERAEPVFGIFQPELSSPPSGPPSRVSRVIYFHLHPGKERQFAEAVGKVHAALQEVEGGWPAYLWYELVSGSLPTYVLSLPRADWAGFDPGDRKMGAAIAAKHGEEAAKAIFERLFEAVEGQYSYFSVLRTDLSYFPEAE